MGLEVLMSKSKSREIEHLRAEIRKLKKNITRSKKRLYEPESEALEEVAEETKVVHKDRCPRCSGKLELLDLNIKKILMCESCNYRTVKK